MLVLLVDSSTWIWSRLSRLHWYFPAPLTAVLAPPLLSAVCCLLCAVCCWFVKLDLLQVQYMNRMGAVMALLKSPTWTAATYESGTVLLNCVGCS